MLSLFLAGTFVGLCVIVHYESLVALNSFLKRFTNHRILIVVVMFGLLVAHVVEIWIFALGYYVLDHWFGLGEIQGVSGLIDYAYYSSVVYTTLGFGDLLPTGTLRVLTGAESLAGLALITWSASFSLIVGQRYWDAQD